MKTLFLLLIFAATMTIAVAQSAPPVPLLDTALILDYPPLDTCEIRDDLMPKARREHPVFPAREKPLKPVQQQRFPIAPQGVIWWYLFKD